MATAREILFGTGNSTQNEVDLIDIAAIVLLPMAASFLFGVFSLQVQVFGNYDLMSPIWTISTLEVSVVFLVSTGSGVWIIATNLLNQQTQQDEYELALIGTAIALPILFELIPAVEDLVMWNDFTQVLAVLYVSTAAVIVSYMG